MDLSLIVKKPIITEKSMKETASHRFTFLVDRRANKNQIAKAVEQLFKVEVLEVRTAKRAGKARRIDKKGRKKRLPGEKKAIVEIKADQRIEVFPVGKREKKKKK